MRLHQFVIKDILRRRRRALYTALGVAIGVAAVIAVLTVTRAGEHRIYSEIDKYGPNLVVAPAVSNIDLKLGDLRLGSLAVGDNYISEDKLIEVRQIADGEVGEALGVRDGGHMVTIAPKLYVNAVVRESSVVVVGIDPIEEGVIKSWWRVSAGRYAEQPREALLGARLSSILEIAPGERISVNGEEWTIAGVLEETASPDDYQIFAPLETVQRAFGKEGLISSMDLRAPCSACPVETIADAVNSSVTGVRAVAVKQIAETEMGLVMKVNRFMLLLAGITLIVGCFGVVNTMMSSVHDRVKDIGIMKAVGASRNQILVMFAYEAVVIGVLGGVLGYLAGTLMAYVIGPLVFDDLSVRYAPQFLLPALGIAVVVALVASIYPALRATRIRVAEALRSL